MDSGIYSITAPSGKRYIGSAVNISRRWGVHKSKLRNGTHHNPYLSNAARKYGIDSLVFEVLEYCPISELVAREQLHIDSATSESLYNICKLAGNVSGRKHSAEALTKMRAAMTPERRARISVEATGRVLAEETRARMRTAQSNRSAAWRRKLSEIQKGKCIPDATRERMSTVRNTSGFKGVSLFKRTGKWAASLRVNKVQIHLGYFDTAELANAQRLREAALRGIK
jgi:group I intron endonuclease